MEKHYFTVIWPVYHNSPAMYCISSKQKDISDFKMHIGKTNEGQILY